MEIDNFNQQFYNPEIELDEKYSNEIHMHRVSRGTRKSDVIIQGLIFKTNEESKAFVSLVSKKFGISGCSKIMEDYDKKNNVFIFTGDKRDEIADILVKTYNKDNEFIKYHG
jgi:translation initiation factor 1 (eIF-1/SUI1)